MPGISDRNPLDSAIGISGIHSQLLGVHEMTISKWERGVLSPSAHHVDLLQSFDKAQKEHPDIGTFAAGVLVGAGASLALFFILKAAFGGGK